MAPSPTPGVIGKLLNVLGSKIGGSNGGRDSGSGPSDRIARLGLSPRQQELNRLWGWYRCANYQTRKQDWNGKQALDPLETEAVASKGFLPPGFYDAGASSMPLKFRKPSAPYALIKVIVDRFTGLLFSENQSPEINVEGDEQSADYLRAVADVARLWQAMIRVRTFGGATGSACVGFQFVDGKPVIEVHDPRWVIADFIDRATLQLRAIEKRYMFPVDVRDPSTGRYETKQFWYRRIIDDQQDVLFKPVEVGDGDEPAWVVDKTVTHGFGFCPVIWVQNMPVEDDIDGDPDCHGIYDVVEQIDALIAQANRGILANCDPTLVISSKAEMGTEIKKGSDNSIKVPDGTVTYLEMSATGPKAAMEQADSLRKYALEVAQCVLDHPDAAAKTATEVERIYVSMLQKADVMREQYGERCIKPLLEMIFRAAKALATPTLQQPAVDPTNGSRLPVTGLEGQDAAAPVAAAPMMVRRVLNLPPKVVIDPATGGKMMVEHDVGNGGALRLMWPDYFPPTLDDVAKAVTAASGAVLGKLVDDETAIKFIAPFFSVEDVPALVAKVQAAAATEQANAFGSIPGLGGDDGSGGEFGYDEEPDYPPQ